VILLDVNVLVYAFRADADRHAEYREWLERAVAGSVPVGISSLVLSGVVRVCTHPRVFTKPSALDETIRYGNLLLEQPNVTHVQPGNRHWEIFTSLCTASGARGNLVADAYLAALAIETGAEWITADRDFARFPGLRWRHPLS